MLSLIIVIRHNLAKFRPTADASYYNLRETYNIYLAAHGLSRTVDSCCIQPLYNQTDERSIQFYAESQKIFARKGALLPVGTF